MLRLLSCCALTCAALAGLSGCGDAPSDDAATAVAIVLPAGSGIVAAAWTVWSSSNHAVASGTVSAIDPTTSASFGVQLPVGSGDRVQMTATTTSGLTCSGTSDPFDVVEGRPLSVSIALACSSNAAAADLASVTLTRPSAPNETCPVIGGYSIGSEGAATANSRFLVSISVTDPDAGDVLTYAWSATAGTFSGAGAPSAEYTCSGSGYPTVSVAVSDNHAPTACILLVTLPAVRCP